MKNDSHEIFKRCLIGSAILHLCMFYTYNGVKSRKALNFSKTNEKRVSIKLIDRVPVKNKEITKKKPHRKTQKVSKINKIKKQPQKNIVSKLEVSNKVSRMDAGLNSQLAAYSKLLRDKIVENKKYPIVAKRLKQQGTAHVSIELSWPNILEKVELSKSSRHEILNKEALDSIHNLDEIPRMPDSLRGEFSQKKLRIQVPISFQLF